MSKPYSKLLSLVLVLTLLVSVVTPALAVTYRPGAQSGPSSSYASGVYYENYKRVPITGDNRTDLIAIALSQLGHQLSGENKFVDSGEGVMFTPDFNGGQLYGYQARQYFG